MDDLPAINPLHTLNSTELGLSSFDHIVVHPSESAVYVLGSRNVIDIAPYYDAYSVWGYSVAGMLLLFLALWRLRRVAVRPRRRGVSYCRRCNYDLSAQLLAAGVCPECGRSTAGRGTII